MKNLKTFEVKFLGVTNTQGNRIVIIDVLRGKRKTFDWNYKYNYALDYALAIFKNANIEVVATTELKNSYLILVEDFKIELKDLVK